MKIWNKMTASVLKHYESLYHCKKILQDFRNRFWTNIEKVEKKARQKAKSKKTKTKNKSSYWLNRLMLLQTNKKKCLFYSSILSIATSTDLYEKWNKSNINTTQNWTTNRKTKQTQAHKSANIESINWRSWYFMHRLKGRRECVISGVGWVKNGYFSSGVFLSSCFTPECRLSITPCCTFEIAWSFSLAWILVCVLVSVCFCAGQQEVTIWLS